MYRTPLTAEEKHILSRVTERQYHRVEYKDDLGRHHLVSDGTYTLYPSEWVQQMLDRNASRSGLTEGERKTIQKYLDNPPALPTAHTLEQLAQVCPPTSRYDETRHLYHKVATRIIADAIYHKLPWAEDAAREMNASLAAMGRRGWSIAA